MDSTRRISVPFERKADARSLHAIFDKKDRCWYIPDDASEEEEQALRNLASLPRENDLDELHSKQEDYISESNVTNSSLQNNIESSSLQSSDSNLEVASWETIINTDNTLQIALAIQKYGMPQDEKQRTRILKLFSLRRPGDYPISYDGMAECSESFSSMYTKEYVVELVKRCIKDGRAYTEQIKNSDLTEEEKALMMMVLPL